MPAPKKNNSTLQQMRRLLKRPRTIDELVLETGLSQVTIYRYLKEIGQGATVVKSSTRPVSFRIMEA